MINGLQGIPGSGKSYEAVVFHVLAALKRGRLVITNLPLLVEQFAAIDPAYRDLIELRRKPQPVLGTWDANRFDDKGNGNAFELFKEGETPPPPRIVAGDFGPRVIGKVKPASVFGNVWDYYSEWKHESGMGPLFVIDECHVPMPRIGTDPEVIEWYKLHRHFNSDVLIATQNFRHMCQDIADLMAMLIKVRKADILGIKNAYIRKVHGGYRGSVISDETRHYQPEYFNLYKSHTQGNSVAESAADDVSPMIVRFKRLNRAILGVALLSCLGVAYYAATKKPKVIRTVKVERGTAPAALPLASASAPRPAASAAVAAAADPAAIPEPYENKTLHMTGRLTMGERVIYTFAVAQNGLIVSNITNADLSRAGYKFQGTTDCTGVLTWLDKSRAVSCDSPAVSMAMAGTSTMPQQVVQAETGPVAIGMQSGGTSPH
jgi:zona occludens toxin